MNRSTASIKRNFASLINSITADDVAKSPGQFTRRRLCPLNDILMLLLSMEGHNLNTEIGNYFFTIGRQPPSKSAFIQQRSKLSEDAFPNLLAATNRLFPFEKTFKGLHLLAVDGSSINIPSLKGDSTTFVSYNSRNGGYYMDHLTAVYDLLEKRYLDAISSPFRQHNENRDLCIMVDRNPLAGEPCLYIADRGFASFNNLAHIINAGQFFLIRCKDPSKSSNLLTGFHFPDSGEADVDHTFILSRKHTGKGQDPVVFKYLHPQRIFDFLPRDDKSGIFEINLRIVRVYISEDKYEYLITNLPHETYPRRVIKELYNARWGIEVSFRSLKYNLALVFFHSCKREFIDQEIFARLIMYNVISLLVGSIKVKQKNTKYEYFISFADAVSHCRRFLLTKMRSTALKNLLLMSLTPIRQGRSSPRNVRSQRLKTLNNRY